MAEIVNGVHIDAALKLARKFIPSAKRSEVAIPAPGEGPGFWVGAPSAAEFDGYIYLAYWLRYLSSYLLGQVNQKDNVRLDRRQQFIGYDAFKIVVAFVRTLTVNPSLKN